VRALSWILGFALGLAADPLSRAVALWRGLAVLLAVGSRFETEESKGAAYFLDRLAYKV